MFKIIPDFLPSGRDGSLFETLMKEIAWGQMTIGTRINSRLASFQGVQKADDSVPWLRCPSIDGQTIHPFTETVSSIVELVNDKFDANVNIVKIQQYMNKKAVIHSHSDKVVDLQDGQKIFIVRVGATRTLKMTPKKECSESKNNDVVKILAPDNSCIVLTYDQNLKWLHSVDKEKKDVGPSISLVLRESVTWKQSDGWLTGPRVNQDQDARDSWDEDKYISDLIDSYRVDNTTCSGLNAYKTVMEQAARV